MTSREHKYLKGDKWMSFFGGSPFNMPAKQFFTLRRIRRMKTTEEYIQWKRQQCIQQRLNESAAVQFTPKSIPFGIIIPNEFFPTMGEINQFVSYHYEPISAQEWETPGYTMKRMPFIVEGEKPDTGRIWRDILSFPLDFGKDQGENDERSVATDAESE